jgi:acetyl esterase/lipase
MKRSILCAALCAAACLLLPSGAFSQTTTPVTPKEPFKIWPGVAPGSEDWTRQEYTVDRPTGGRAVYNVVTPTLLPYLPDPAKATGTGIIVAPGGGFSYLAFDKEGTQAAQWLASHGIAAFVLKYRVTEAPPQGAAAASRGQGTPAAARGEGAPATRGGAAPAARGEGAPAARGGQAGGSANLDESGKYGIADGLQAVKALRQRASEFGIKPDRIGVLGFSAGAMVASGTLLLSEEGNRPNFVAPIYGGPFGVMPPIPKGLPPVFMAWAVNDSLAGPVAGALYEQLKKAGSAPEVHIFNAGGHGFGMDRKGTTSDHWIDIFYYWLEVQGLTKPASK